MGFYFSISFHRLQLQSLTPPHAEPTFKHPGGSTDLNELQTCNRKSHHPSHVIRRKARAMIALVMVGVHCEHTYWRTTWQGCRVARLREKARENICVDGGGACVFKCICANMESSPALTNFTWRSCFTSQHLYKERWAACLLTMISMHKHWHQTPPQSSKKQRGSWPCFAEDHWNYKTLHQMHVVAPQWADM